MNIHQQFLAKTLFDLHRSEVIDTAKCKGPHAAYDLLENKWTFIAMTLESRNICKFHELNINNSRIRDVVESVISELENEVYEWIEEWRLRYGDA